MAIFLPFHVQIKAFRRWPCSCSTKKIKNKIKQHTHFESKGLKDNIFSFLLIIFSKFHIFNFSDIQRLQAHTTDHPQWLCTLGYLNPTVFCSVRRGSGTGHCSSSRPHSYTPLHSSWRSLQGRLRRPRCNIPQGHSHGLPPCTHCQAAWSKQKQTKKKQKKIWYQLYINYIPVKAIWSCFLIIHQIHGLSLSLPFVLVELHDLTTGTPPMWPSLIVSAGEGWKALWTLLFPVVMKDLIQSVSGCPLCRFRVDTGIIEHTPVHVRVKVIMTRENSKAVKF